MLENTDPVQASELSPVKRALLEIRQLRAELETKHRAEHEPIAILGMALRLPGDITTLERFWEALATGEDLITPVPEERWDASEYLHADPDHTGTMYDAHGGFIANIDRFDAEFFGINAREAASMDPQHRMLLELSWEALEHAGIDPKSLAGSSCGVYVGMSSSDYGRQTMQDARDIHAYSAVGSALSIAAGRISYFLGLHGPGMVVDTACSSSLVAVSLAMEALRSGKIEMAIVGGSNAILSPGCNVSFARTRMLSRDGRCKTFDAAADGYVRGEACCVMILKLISDARRDGDRVLASIAGAAINQDGRSAGITAPNGPAQEAVIRAALDDAGIDPSKVSYVEAHGTGTPLGDPIEMQALGSVYGSSKIAGSPLMIGSVKTNLGHTEAAAGLVGLMKTVLMLQPDRGIAPSLHFHHPNSAVDMEKLHLHVPTELMPWRQEQPLYAGISSFGFSGTNAHLVITAADRVNASEMTKAGNQDSLLMLSAASDVALRAMAQSYTDFLAITHESFFGICKNAAMGRAALQRRLTLRANGSQAASEMLQRWLAGESVESIKTSSSESFEIQGEKVDSLSQMQAAFLRGMNVRNQMFAQDVAYRRVDLPIYPFQRSSYWWNADPITYRKQAAQQRWQNAVDCAEQASRCGPLGWRLDRFHDKFAAMHELTLAHAQNAFVEAGVFQEQEQLLPEEVISRAGFQPLYRNLITRWLKGLAEKDMLIEENGRYRAASILERVSLSSHWQHVEALLEDDPGTLAYLRQCGALLNDVMTGRVSALETLFPNGSFTLTEGLYESGTIARYFNAIAASAVAEVVRVIGTGRNARVLEIGGGTGGTTSAILPLLPPHQVEYWFTDLSDLFLARAQKKFGNHPFVRYTIFDLDRALEEQSIAGSRFDVIMAANVVHAARNLTGALTRIRRLLAPGGVLVLLESTVHHSWFDMTTGLIEGWQHFDDEDRGDQPLLNPDQWKKALQRNGFSDVAAFPSNSLPTVVLGQHVLLVRADSIESTPKDLQTSQYNVAKQKNFDLSSRVSHADTEDLSVHIASLPLDEQEATMLTFVQDTIHRVFQLSIQPEELGQRDRLSDLGMDSLIALELRSELTKGLGSGIQIASTIAFDAGTVGELANVLLSTIQPQQNKKEVIAESASRSSMAPVTEQVLSEMTDEEVEQLLKERLSRR